MQNNLSQLALPPGHGLKRRILRRFGNALNNARILNGKKSFGHNDIQQHCQHQRTTGHGQRKALVAQHPVEFFFVPGQQVGKKAAAFLLPGVVGSMLVGVMLWPQHDRAQHGRKRE